MLNKSKQFLIAAVCLFIVYSLYAIWTFTQTDPNLVISSNPTFWSFQQWSWQLSDHLITQVYVALVTSALFSYAWIVKVSRDLQLSIKKIFLTLLLVTAPLFFSNNALSHDVFNYMFNALMVVKYGANPHVKTALDFSFEPWTRFMHNVHTPAPYFYGWTALSIPPYILGFQKFLFTWFLFRTWSALGFFLTLFFVWLLISEKTKDKIQAFCVLAFSPLFAIELISNAHNDGWLMWPAFASLYIITPTKNKKWFWPRVVLSVLLLLLSMSTKYVTIVFVPIWLFSFFNNFPKIKSFFSMLMNKISVLSKQYSVPDFSTVLHFIPLTTSRSKLFLPWYLTWSMSFYPLIKSNFLKQGLIVLSISSLFRYLPWLWYGGFEYTPQIELNQKLITWIPVIISSLFYIAFLAIKSVRKR